MVLLGKSMKLVAGIVEKSETEQSGTPFSDAIQDIWNNFNASILWETLSPKWGGSFSLSALHEKVLNSTKSFMNETAQERTKSVSENLINSLLDQCIDFLFQTTATKEFHFYLVDEYTMEPLTGCEDYPITIPVYSETFKTFKTLVPYAQVLLVFIFCGRIFKS